MSLNRVKRITLIPLVILAASFRCSNERDDTAINKCDCRTAPTVEEKKDVEAVVVQTSNIEQGQPIYALSTEPNDFGRSSYTVQSILIACDSLPPQYRRGGTMLVISYERKDCCGVLTSPSFRSSYGCYVNLTSIRVKP